MAKKNANGGGGGFSVRSKDSTSGGGTEGALATISEIGYVEEFTYGGRQKDNPQAALHVVYDIEGFDKPWDDNLTVGPSDKYEVLEDGDAIRSVGKQTGLNKNCKAKLFFDSVEAAAEEAGLDIDELVPEIDGGVYSIRPLEGMRVTLTNVPFETVGGDKKDCVVIGSFVVDEGTPKKGKATKSNGKASSAQLAYKASKGPSIEEQTEEAVCALIEEKTSVKKSDIGNLIYAADRKNPDIKAMMQLTFKDVWIGDDDRPWTLNKKTGKVTAKDAE